MGNFIWGGGGCDSFSCFESDESSGHIPPTYRLKGLLNILPSTINSWIFRMRSFSSNLPILDLDNKITFTSTAYFSSPMRSTFLVSTILKICHK
jgi:hypothetical protein